MLNELSHNILSYIGHVQNYLEIEGKGKVKSAYQAYPSFCSMKQLGVFLISAGRDASPSQGYLQH